MEINRKELDEKTFQWFNSSISDKDYNSLWRLLKAVDGESANSKYLKFEMPTIKEVYLGARFRDSITESNWIYDTLCEICKAKNIEIIETHLNTGLYKVDIPN